MADLINEISQYRHSGDGMMSGDKFVHMALSTNQVHRLMGDLLQWLDQGNEYPLIKSSFFYYEFEFIHPFANGNRRIWQILILSHWVPCFKKILLKARSIRIRKRIMTYFRKAMIFY